MPACVAAILAALSLMGQPTQEITPHDLAQTQEIIINEAGVFFNMGESGGYWFEFQSVPLIKRDRAVAARRAHNPEAGGSTPPPATIG